MRVIYHFFFFSKNDFQAILDHKNFSCIVHPSQGSLRTPWSSHECLVRPTCKAVQLACRALRPTRQYFYQFLGGGSDPKVIKITFFEAFPYSVPGISCQGLILDCCYNYHLYSLQLNKLYYKSNIMN